MGAYTNVEHFSAWLTDSDGNRIDLLANDTGRVDITQAVRIEDSGKYLINVEADGEWTIDISQE